MGLLNNKNGQNNRIRLIVCDMDGTLLDSHKRISRENREAIKAAGRNGIGFSVCTGRIQPMTEYYLKDLELKLPVITANGALIWDPVQRRVLWEQPMDSKEVIKILEFAKAHQLDYCALTMNVSYFSKGNIRRQRFEQYNRIAGQDQRCHMKLEEFSDSFVQMKVEKVYKILIYETDRERYDLAAGFLKGLSNTDYTSSEPGLLDIAHRFVNKGDSLCRLAGMLEIPLENVCAMGDYQNDIPMLSAVDYSVAMENGCSEIKEKANYLTRSNDESGVAWFIRQYLRELP